MTATSKSSKESPKTQTGQAQTGKAVAPVAPSFNALVRSWIPAMEKVLPRHLTGERMLALMNLVANKTPKLKECALTKGGQLSLYTAMMNASRLGLEIGSLAHIVPFENSRAGIVEAVLIPDYRGLIHLAVSSGKVQHIDARVVYEGDEFDYQLGTQPTIRHKPKLRESVPANEQIIAFYAVGHLNGTFGFEVMSKAEVDAIRARARAKDNGPWVTDYPMMGRKTVVKRLAKYLPQTPELVAAIELDNRGETGEVGTVSDIIDTSDSLNQAVADQTRQKAEDLKARLGERPAGEQPPAEQGRDPEPVETTGREVPEKGWGSRAACPGKVNSDGPRGWQSR